MDLAPASYLSLLLLFTPSIHSILCCQRTVTKTKMWSSHSPLWNPLVTAHFCGDEIRVLWQSLYWSLPATPCLPLQAHLLLFSRSLTKLLSLFFSRAFFIFCFTSRPSYSFYLEYSLFPLQSFAGWFLLVLQIFVIYLSWTTKTPVIFIAYEMCNYQAVRNCCFLFWEGQGPCLSCLSQTSPTLQMFHKYLWIDEGRKEWRMNTVRSAFKLKMETQTREHSLTLSGYGEEVWRKVMCGDIGSGP